MGEPKDRSKLFIPPTRFFDEAFPTLEDAVLRFQEFEYGEPTRRRGIFSLRREGSGILRCGNSLCHRGGYEIDREVHKMLEEKLTEKQIELSCRGDEGTPKGKRKGRSCAFSIEGKITLKFKGEDAKPSDESPAPTTKS